MQLAPQSGAMPPCGESLAELRTLTSKFAPALRFQPLEVLPGKNRGFDGMSLAAPVSGVFESTGDYGDQAVVAVQSAEVPMAG